MLPAARAECLFPVVCGAVRRLPALAPSSFRLEFLMQRSAPRFIPRLLMAPAVLTLFLWMIVLPNA